MSHFPDPEEVRTMKGKNCVFIIFLILLNVLVSMAYSLPRDTVTVLGISTAESLAYSPNGRILAMTDNNIIFLMDTHTYTQVGVLMGEVDRPDNEFRSDRIYSIAFSPDGSILASGHGDTVMTIWDVKTMEERLSFIAHDGETNNTGEMATVTDLAFHPRGEALASASDDMTVKLWDIHTWEEIRVIRGHTDGVEAIAFDIGGKTLASGGWDGAVRLWEIGMDLSVTDGPVLRDQDFIKHLAFMPSFSGETLIAFASWDYVLDHGVVKLWKGLARLDPVVLQADEPVLQPVFEKDGRTVITAGDRVRFWDVETGNIVQSLSRHSESDVIAIHPDGRTLASVKDPRPLRVWDIVTEELKHELPGKRNSIDFRFSDDGKYVISAARGISSERRIEIQRWDIETGRLISSDILSGVSVRSASRGFLSPDGEQFMSPSSDGIYRWKLPEAEFLPPFEALGGLIAYSADDTIAVGDSEGVIYLLDSGTGEKKGTLYGHDAAISSMTFSSDARFLASGDIDGVIILWDVSEHRQLGTWHGHEKWLGRYPELAGSGVLSLDFSPDGRMLASGGGEPDHTVRLWDLEIEGKLLQTLVGHETGVRSLDFSPDGRLLISGGATDVSDAVILWDVESGESLWTIGYEAHNVRFDPTGKQVGMEIRGYIFVWNLDRLIEIDTITAVSDGLFPVRWGEIRHDNVPAEHALLSNYPNPFNPETWIPFKLSRGSHVTIQIHDVSGHLVRSLFLGYRSAGSYMTRDKAAYWDGRNESGDRVSSGIYFYNMKVSKASSFRSVRKMVVTR
jgi:WD40 repeat protein